MPETAVTLHQLTAWVLEGLFEASIDRWRITGNWEAIHSGDPIEPKGNLLRTTAKRRGTKLSQI